MNKPSDRIYELIGVAATVRLNQQLADPSMGLAMKLSGTTPENMHETLMHDTRIHVVALIQYLDEILPDILARGAANTASALDREGL